MPMHPAPWPIWRIRWRRQDVHGCDRCQVRSTACGWRLDGTAAFDHPQGPARLAYAVGTDHRWRSRWARIDGAIGPRSVRIRIWRHPDGWRLNGAPIRQARDGIDLDLGFTPATNLIAVRRLALPIGASAHISTAWLDDSASDLGVLEQRYERRSAAAYWYEAPRFGYAALLRMDGAGFAVEYPGLWMAERSRW